MRSARESDDPTFDRWNSAARLGQFTLRLAHRTLMMMGGPTLGQETEDPSAFLFQTLIGLTNVQKHGDPAARTIQFTGIVSCNVLKSHHAAMKVVGAVGLSFENISDVVREITLHGFLDSCPHDGTDHDDVAAILGEHCKATDLSDPVVAKESLEIEVRNGHLESVGTVQIDGEIVENAKHGNGERIHTNDEPLGWDGTFKGQELNIDVFVWVAEIEFIDGEIIQLSGDVTLVR